MVYRAGHLIYEWRVALGQGGMPTSSWACCRGPRTYEHAHVFVGMPRNVKKS